MASAPRYWRAAEPAAAAEWDAAWEGRPSGEVGPRLPSFEGPKISTRSASGKAMQAFADLVPTMIGGSADLASSTKTEFADEPGYSRESAGRNVHWGVREHAMGSPSTALPCTGGSSGPTGRPSLSSPTACDPRFRLSAIMGLPVAWVFSHDSIGVGEDGPTHQPIEHYAGAGDPRPDRDPPRRRRRDRSRPGGSPWRSSRGRSASC